MTPLILCADDYGYSEAADQGILRLIDMQRLTATSCMVMSPRWLQAAHSLTSARKAQADIGLHLDFTEFGRPLRKSHPLLVLQSLTFTLPTRKILATISMQLDQFEQATGFAPDYIDGHQHVHQLPQIREVLLEQLTRRYGDKLPWLRVSRPVDTSVKGRLISALGAKSLEAKAHVHAFSYTRHLLGVYDFGADMPYLDRLEQWLEQTSTLRGPALLMCHPATRSDDAAHDPIYPARTEEYMALASDAFAKLLEKHRITLVKGSHSLLPDRGNN